MRCLYYEYGRFCSPSGAAITILGSVSTNAMEVVIMSLLRRQAVSSERQERSSKSKPTVTFISAHSNKQPVALTDIYTPDVYYTALTMNSS